jgi:hypothetical protein
VTPVVVDDAAAHTLRRSFLANNLIADALMNTEEGMALMALVEEVALVIRQDGCRNLPCEWSAQRQNPKAHESSNNRWERLNACISARERVELGLKHEEWLAKQCEEEETLRLRSAPPTVTPTDVPEPDVHPYDLSDEDAV